MTVAFMTSYEIFATFLLALNIAFFMLCKCLFKMMHRQIIYALLYRINIFITNIFCDFFKTRHHGLKCIFHKNIYAWMLVINKLFNLGFFCHGPFCAALVVGLLLTAETAWCAFVGWLDAVLSPGTLYSKKGGGAVMEAPCVSPLLPICRCSVDTLCVQLWKFSMPPI